MADFNLPGHIRPSLHPHSQQPPALKVVQVATSVSQGLPAVLGVMVPSKALDDD